jgi:hypothetical protein
VGKYTYTNIHLTSGSPTSQLPLPRKARPRPGAPDPSSRHRIHRRPRWAAALSCRPSEVRGRRPGARNARSVAEKARRAQAGALPEQPRQPPFPAVEDPGPPPQHPSSAAGRPRSGPPGPNLAHKRSSWRRRRRPGHSAALTATTTADSP